ncbi:MAG: hypothetical protein KA408_05905 [Flavobacteriales bacterium]|nr:hypothetical protein [Flavobacteriales bacterium]
MTLYILFQLYPVLVRLWCQEFVKHFVATVPLDTLFKVDVPYFLKVIIFALETLIQRWPTQ